MRVEATIMNLRHITAALLARLVFGAGAGASGVTSDGDEQSAAGHDVSGDSDQA
jgi:hypothetical protein